MSVQKTPPSCPFCRAPLIPFGSKIVCPYDKIMISWESYKTNEAIVFTNKEKEEELEKAKEEAKARHIQSEKDKRKKND